MGIFKTKWILPKAYYEHNIEATYISNLHKQERKYVLCENVPF